MTDTMFPKGSGGFLNPEVVANEFGIMKGMRIADFGCGAGYFTTVIARLVGEEGKVAGIDILEEALSALRNRAQLFHLQNITYIQSDLEKEGGSTLEEHSQDIVLIANLLFQIKDKEAPLKEAKRILKEGGRLILIDWKPEALFGPQDEERLHPARARELVQNQGFTFEHEFLADNYHWGFIARS